MGARKAIAIFLFTLYVALQLRVYTPYIDYLINKEYIATVLCEEKDDPISICKGSCYLIKELKQKQEESQNKQLPQRIKLNLPFIHTTSNLEFNVNNMAIRCKFNAFDTHIAKQYALDIPTPPPRLV